MFTIQDILQTASIMTSTLATPEKNVYRDHH